MIRIIQFLIYGHFHKWKIIKVGKYADYDDSFSSSPRLIAKGDQYTLQCEVCGKMKEHKT